MRFFAVIIAVGATQIVGCASIVNGQNQSVSVEARSETGAVAGATCKLKNDKGEWFITSPGSTVVRRSYEDLSVRCDKEPHQPGMVSIKSSTKGMAFGNILFGGIIGAGVDMSTGAAYDYPALITVTMGANAANVPATPSIPAEMQPASSKNPKDAVAPAAPAASASAA